MLPLPPGLSTCTWKGLAVPSSTALWLDTTAFSFFGCPLLPGFSFVLVVGVGLFALQGTVLVPDTVAFCFFGCPLLPLGCPFERGALKLTGIPFALALPPRILPASSWEPPLPSPPFLPPFLRTDGCLVVLLGPDLCSLGCPDGRDFSDAS